MELTVPLVSNGAGAGPGIIGIIGLVLFIILLIYAPWLIGIFFLISGILLMFIPIIGWIPGLILILIGVILIAVGFGRRGKIEIKQQVQQIMHPSESARESVKKVIVCPYCDTENKTKAKYCSDCGERLRGKKKPSKKK